VHYLKATFKSIENSPLAAFAYFYLDPNSIPSKTVQKNRGNGFGRVTAVFERVSVKLEN
jgi:hypothetical protein